MKKKNWIKDLILVLLGNLIIACEVAFIVLPNDLLDGGVAGLSVALQPLIPIDPVWMINGLTIGLFLLGLIFLGKAFALKTVVSAIAYPVFVTLLSSVAAQFPESTFVLPDYLAAVYAGALAGFGLGLAFRANASTGGMDIPALILRKYAKIPSGQAVMIIDVLTVSLGIFTYGLQKALVGIITAFIAGQVINKTVLLGSQSAKNLMVISSKWDEIRDYLMNTLSRGVTVLSGKGGYTQQDRPVVMCVISRKEYPAVEQAINKIDPAAFMVVSDVNEIHGSGFTFEDGTLNRDIW
ncbi:YitT family protein [uncultured Faecalicoccus sp.]|uniref:YitT family protein n=1 Tax=uncultured Faecalicoccus sp. TaxID=1971760 RepID=UPI002601EF9A|nr:YitT family protein [uncultured Faecalicoccus sp.]